MVKYGGAYGIHKGIIGPHTYVMAGIGQSATACFTSIIITKRGNLYKVV